MKKLILSFVLIGTCITGKAQWAVFDPSNFAQNLITANNMINNVAQTKNLLEQGEKYYNSLMEVSSFVRNSKNVANSIKLSARTLKEYNATLGEISSDTNYTSDQIRTYCKQQNNIIESISKTIEDLNKIIINTGMSMSDKERLDAIDTYYHKVIELYKSSKNLNFQMKGQTETIERRKAEKRLERQLLQ